MEPACETRAEVWSSEQWIAYFEANSKRLLTIPWEVGAGVSPEQLASIAGSLSGWQLGETSDGRHLLAAAANYAARLDDPSFLDAIRLFIKEEQRHGADLGGFLDLAGVPRKTWDLGDALFRAFRYVLPRLEIWATVVVMVETHALLYYAAIRRATGSQVLRRVCQQILVDEIPHIRFQCERLAILHRGRPRIPRSLTLVAQRVLFGGVTLAIWLGHGRALRAGGFTFGRYWRTAWAKMGHAWGMMDPRVFQWKNPGVESRERLETTT